MSDLREYVIRPEEKLGDWAIIVINTKNGYFSCVSDYGNYAYIWSSPGCEFRQFLTQLNPDYLYSKLMYGRTHREYDGEATQKAVRDFINEQKESHEWGAEKVEEELGFTDDLTDGEMGFQRWLDQTQIAEAHYFCRNSCDRQTVMFCEKLWPRFAALLKKELEDERRQDLLHKRSRRGVCPMCLKRPPYSYMLFCGAACSQKNEANEPLAPMAAEDK